MSTEENSFYPGVDNPGADETGEQMEMGNLNPYDSSDQSDVARLILQVITEHMGKLHLVEI